MVKNKVGGNKAKKFARKNVNASIQPRKLRFAQHEDEVYGIVNRMIGNGQVIVLCSDSKERLCFIRNKFSGRNKQSNLVTVGSWVIVGLRSWETTKSGKLEKCDLLEIYTDNEKHTLHQQCNVNFDALFNEESKLMNINDSDGAPKDEILFAYNDIEKKNDENDENNDDNLKGKKVVHQHNSGSSSWKVDDIDFDDI
jgi:initiation factor 1A